MSSSQGGTKLQRKNAADKKSEQHPYNPQPKPSSVQSAVGGAHQESVSTAINEHARTDHQLSKQSSSARNEPSIHPVGWCFEPSGRSTVEQIFNARVIIEKCIQHQRDLFHNFIDVKKAFGRVFHAGLWLVLRSFNIEEGLAQAIQAPHENSSNAVLLNSQLREFFKTTVGVRQECLLSSILFNLFLEKNMQETLRDHQTSISIEGRPICSLRFADDIDIMGGTNGILQDLTSRLVNRATPFGMEVSTEKRKILTKA